MIFLLFLCTLMLAEAHLKNDNDCNGGQLVTTINKEILKQKLNNPHEFTIDYSLNTLYFSHGENQQLVKVDLITKKIKNIENIMSRSQSVNQKNHEVYLATKRGIHKYDPKTNEIEYVGAENKTIALVYFKDKLYYIENGTGAVFKTIDGEEVKIGEFKTGTEHFVVDNNGTFFFSTDDLQSLDHGENKSIVLYKGSTGLDIRALATDLNSQVYACTKHGIFHINKEKHTLENVVTQLTANCSGLAIDKDNNIIYSDGKNIFILKQKAKCIKFDN